METHKALSMAIKKLIADGVVENQEDLAEKMGYKPGTLSGYKTGKKAISSDFIEAFEDMFRIKLDSMTMPYREQLRDKKLNPEPNGIPIYEDSPMTLSNIESYRDTPADQPDFWISIPGLRKCNYGCRATGDSMHPLIRNHALVVGEEVKEAKQVVYGDVYIIQLASGIETVKYLHPCETDDSCILLVPYNERVPRTKVSKTEILKLYRAKAVFNVL